MEQEIWKDIPGYTGLYQVSNFGRVKSLYRVVAHSRKVNQVVTEKYLKQGTGSHGYFNVNLSNGRRKTFTVHQLVGMAFLGHIPKSYESVINHKNCNSKHQ